MINFLGLKTNIFVHFSNHEKNLHYDITLPLQINLLLCINDNVIDQIETVKAAPNASVITSCTA